MKYGSMLKSAVVSLAFGAAVALPTRNFAAEESPGSTQTITGEVVDLMCYLDHGAKGEKHKGCAEKCIASGGPVGILSGDQVYLIVGEHQPMNKELASKAAQTVTVKGKVVERSGMKLIENAQL